MSTAQSVLSMHFLSQSVDGMLHTLHAGLWRIISRLKIGNGKAQIGNVQIGNVEMFRLENVEMFRLENVEMLRLEMLRLETSSWEMPRLAERNGPPWPP